MNTTVSLITAAVLVAGIAIFSINCGGGGGGGGTGLGLLLFAGNDGAGGASYNGNYEPWSFDGAAASKIAEINSTNSGSYPRDFIEHGDMVLFNANDGIHGSELWGTDGVNAWMVSDLALSVSPAFAGVGPVLLRVAGGSPRNFTSFGGNVYFIAYDGLDTGLFVTDGTTAGTSQIVSNALPLQVSRIYDLEVFNGGLVFSGSSISQGQGIFATDGTAGAETVIVAGFTSAGDMAAMGQTLYFSADDGSRGSELWATDGTAAGTTLVKDIETAGSSSWPNFLTPLDGTLYFNAYTGSEGYELWSTDGTAEGTTLQDLYPGTATSYPRYLTPYKGKLYFSAQYESVGTEVWWTDNSGAQMLTDINPGVNVSSYPGFFVEYNGRLYFNATTSTYGNELWSTDGTAAGTEMAIDIWTGTGNGVYRMVPD
jgi:ELWxxDGT repeat protein